LINRVKASFIAYMMSSHETGRINTRFSKKNLVFSISNTSLESLVEYCASVSRQGTHEDDRRNPRPTAVGRDVPTVAAGRVLPGGRREIRGLEKTIFSCRFPLKPWNDEDDDDDGTS